MKERVPTQITTIGTTTDTSGGTDTDTGASASARRFKDHNSDGWPGSKEVRGKLKVG